jgi:hypothetical protein
MSARVLLAAPALALVLAASPAAAKPGSTAKVTEMMRDPATQQAVARAVAAMTDAMLDMPLDSVARAAEAMGDRRTARQLRGATVGDYAGPEARDMTRKLPQVMGAVGGMAAAAEEMTPAIKAMAKEMGARMKEAMRDGVPAEDRDYREDRRDDGPPPSAQDEPVDGPLAVPAPDQ